MERSCQERFVTGGSGVELLKEISYGVITKMILSGSVATELAQTCMLTPISIS
jgi:hypothetical protein